MDRSAGRSWTPSDRSPVPTASRVSASTVGCASRGLRRELIAVAHVPSRALRGRDRRPARCLRRLGGGRAARAGHRESHLRAAAHSGQPAHRRLRRRGDDHEPGLRRCRRRRVPRARASRRWPPRAARSCCTADEPILAAFHSASGGPHGRGRGGLGAAPVPYLVSQSGRRRGRCALYLLARGGLPPHTRAGLWIGWGSESVRIEASRRVTERWPSGRVRGPVGEGTARRAGIPSDLRPRSCVSVLGEVGASRVRSSKVAKATRGRR